MQAKAKRRDACARQKAMCAKRLRAKMQKSSKPILLCRRLLCLSLLFPLTQQKLLIAQHPRPVSTHTVETRSSLAAIDSIMQEGVAKEEIPGGVVLIGHNGKVIYRKAFGWRSLEPSRERMTAETIFDLASLTKCVATT